MQCVYKQPSFDANGQVISTEVIVVNTDDVNQRQVWDWIGAQIGALGWAPQLIEIKYLTGKVVNRTITIQFKMPPEVPQTNLVFGLLGADSCECLTGPEAAVVDLGRQIGVAYDINELEYVDPDTVDTTPGVTSDWEQPGSPLGPPFGPTWASWFEWTDRAAGYELHSTYVGASGRRYLAIATPAAAKRKVSTPQIWKGQ